MLVVNIRHSVVLTDYNGKRFAFYPGKPVDISPEIYNSIVQSKHINSDDIRPYIEPKKELKPEDMPKYIHTEEKVEEPKRKPGRPRGK